jgi:protein SCO1/2
MLRTAIACLALLVSAWASAAWLTHDFQVWTAEGARRLEVALRPVPTPEAAVEGPALPAGGVALRGLVADGRHVTIAGFFYTRCETVCLALGGTFQQLQAALQEDSAGGRMRLLSVSIDPQRDGPAELAAYARRMHGDPALWQFARVADEAAMQRLLADFQVVAVKDARGDIEHNAALLVIDAQGRLVRVFDIADQQLALDYARYIAAQGERS